ncbi:MAG: hemerythrin family protein [Nitrospirae bacterium]|nr:hemerythrin family protein [Nitrospirota bacterium]MBF0540003.1 hemerythrin family protein [Nitrospirota bacterium]
MPFITFDEKITVHIKEIDDHHQTLVRLINELYDAVVEGKGEETVSVVLPELINYTMYHFFAEEDYMVKYEYPKYHDHKMEHAKLIDQTLELYERYNEGVKISNAVLDFLKDWLNGHIMGLDIELGHFLQERKVA